MSNYSLRKTPKEVKIGCHGGYWGRASVPAEGWGEVTYDILGRGNSTCKGPGRDITEGLVSSAVWLELTRECGMARAERGTARA